MLGLVERSAEDHAFSHSFYLYLQLKALHLDITEVFLFFQHPQRLPFEQSLSSRLGCSTHVSSRLPGSVTAKTLRLWAANIILRLPATCKGNSGILGDRPLVA